VRVCTTVNLDDNLLSSARERPRERGQFLEDAIRREFRRATAEAEPSDPRASRGRRHATGVRPRVQPVDPGSVERGLADRGAALKLLDELVSFRRDFARFPGLRWTRPGSS